MSGSAASAIRGCNVHFLMFRVSGFKFLVVDELETWNVQPETPGNERRAKRTVSEAPEPLPPPPSGTLFPASGE